MIIFIFADYLIRLHAMRTFLLILMTFFLLPLSVSAQDLDAATLAKRAGRKNLTIKEWNTDAKSKTRWLDRVTTYDELGRKI